MNYVKMYTKIPPSTTNVLMFYGITYSTTVQDTNDNQGRHVRECRVDLE